MSKTFAQQHPLEYRAYESMKRRIKRDGLSLHPDFETFEGFFRALGPKTQPSDTVDRLDPADPEYGPEKVRWLDKRGQANNRRNTVFLKYDGNALPEYAGQQHPLTIWADILGKNAQTLRRQRHDGWTDNEIIEGSREHKIKSFQQMSKGELANYQPWPEETKNEDEERFLNERKRGENRFEFERRVLIGRLYRKYRFELGQVCEVPDKDDPDPFADIPDHHVFDGVYLRSVEFEEFFVRTAAMLRQLRKLAEESAKEELAWQKAIDRYRTEAQRAKVAREMLTGARYDDEDLGFDSDDQ